MGKNQDTPQQAAGFFTSGTASVKSHGIVDLDSCG